MIASASVLSDAQVMMIKTGLALNEIPVKGSSQKIRPFLLHQTAEDGDGELSTNQTRLSRRFRDARTYPTKNDVSESFHCAIGPVLSLAQAFGAFPVSGLRSSSPNKLQFRTFSFLTFSSLFVIIMILFVTIVSMIHTVKTLNAAAFRTQGGIPAATAGAAFYGNGLLVAILFFRLSSRWMSFQCEWRAMEHHIDSNCTESPRLRWKFFLISSVILLLAVIEHILSIINNVEDYEWNGSTNSTFSNFLEIYCLKSHPFIFSTLDYNFSFGLYIFIVSKLATFMWNFMDLFVILVSTGLAERYKSLNKKVATTVAKNRLRFDWREIRKNYAILSCVVKKVDDQISSIIFLSFANNLYFICLQLLNALSYEQLMIVGSRFIILDEPQRLSRQFITVGLRNRDSRANAHHMFLVVLDFQETISENPPKPIDPKERQFVLCQYARSIQRFFCLIRRPSESTTISGIYFFGSFAFLIGRTCFVTLCAARINVHSKEALPSLYNCPAATYNVEAQRLEYQLATDEVVLTGLRFFPITRNFMLAVAGAIMTYEIVLLQFHKNASI